MRTRKSSWIALTLWICLACALEDRGQYTCFEAWLVLREAEVDMLASKRTHLKTVDCGTSLGQHTDAQCLPGS